MSDVARNAVGIAFDGQRIWTASVGLGTGIPGTGAISIVTLNPVTVTTITTGFSTPKGILYDGTNIWVPNSNSNTVKVVRAVGGLSGLVLATLTGNGLNDPTTAAFDGERILVTNISGHSVSLWKASDLTPIGTISTGPSTFPMGVCSDGLNFWVTLSGPHKKLARF